MCNEQYCKIFEADDGFIKPGITLREIFADGVRRGLYDETVDQLMERRLALLVEQRPVIYQRTLADNRTIEMSICPMANGGWVGTYEDVTERERIARETRQQNLLFDAAINNMSQGLCVFNADQRIIVSNAQYAKIYGGDPELVKPGRSLLELYQDGVTRGLYQGAAEELYAARLAKLAENRPFAFESERGDGSTIAVSICPMANGGWVGTYEDISGNGFTLAEGSG